jgi:DNA processing protein
MKEKIGEERLMQIMGGLEERDWLYSLVLQQGLGRKRIWELYHAAGSFSAAAAQWGGENRRRGKVTLDPEQVMSDKMQRLEQGIEFICFLDCGFPPALAEIPDPPLLLFYRGDLSCLQKPLLGVVGSRKPTPYGKAACAHLTEQLGQAGFAIVSGLAYGIDAEAHRTALRCKAATIGVLGCGIDQVYPPLHRSLFQDVSRAGLLLSEYPPGTPPFAGLFPDRNRIISGLSLGVLLIEAAERSGSLITADFALEQGREVFAVPGPIFSPVSAGPHNLIKQGAKLVTGAQDIIEEFPRLFPAVSVRQTAEHPPVLDEEEKKLMQVIAYDPIHWNELYATIDPAERRLLDRNLFRLETKGLIVSLAGGYYARRGKGT